ncbi:MAG: pilus assembly protein TadG-related protein [Acidimicrobiales bacterium]
MRRLLARRADEGGAVLVFMSIAMVVLIGSTALAVDVGQLTDTNRDLQAVADVVSLDAARALNGSNVGILSHPSTGAVTLAVAASAARNNFPVSQLTVVLGTKTGTSPFVPAANGAVIPDAVRVTAAETVDFAFAPGESSASRKAVGMANAGAGFSVGSFLASISAKDNTVLSGIFGSAFGVNVLSYNGLVGANLTLEAIGLEMPLGVLTPNELLTTEVEAADLFLASADALRLQGNTAAANVLDAMRLSMTGSHLVRLGDTITAETGSESAAATAQLNVLRMLTAAAFAVDGTHAITIPAAQLAIPGVGAVVLSLDVIEPPKTVFGPVGVFAETAQVRATVTPTLSLSTSANVNGCSLSSLLGALLSLSIGELLTCTLGGFVSRIISLNLNASIPITLEAAGAKATLTAINCAAPQSITITPEPQPLTLNANVDLTFTGTVLGNPLGNVLRVRGTAGAKTTTTAPPQNFLYPSQFGVPRPVGSGALGLAGLTAFTPTEVTLLNLNLGPVLSGLTSVVLPVVNTVMSSLDSVLVNPLNDLLGLNLGGADITALAMYCNGVKLAE